ncbi:ATP-binding protein [Oerskovia sp. Root918]|uniref:ATP-binding protein n=1 Tax=Oerskovia sp. Root918 TaxID=1736607 RepID=UPI0035169F00
MHGLPAVTIEGPRAVGKTATALRRAQTVVALDDPATETLTSADPTRLTRLPGPVLVDEWQRVPSVWDVVRRDVDENPTPGRYLLTGSSAPSKPPTHSGAGRIVRARMRPMTLSERHVQPVTVSLAELLSGDVPPVGGESSMRLADYADEIVSSGFPALRSLPSSVRDDALDGYLDGLVEHDFPELGVTVRRPATLRAWLTAYAAATSSTASYNAILDAATPGLPDKPAKATTIGYRDALSKLWMLDEVPAWTGGLNHLNNLAQSPKHHLADPALAARLLGVGTAKLLDDPHHGPPVVRDGPLLGALFEALVTLSVRVYADAARATTSHLRTSRGDHEVDLIVQRQDGKFLAIEVKLAADVTDTDVKHLRWLRDRAGDDLLDAVVVTTGPGAYRRRDGIAVVPAGLLGP